MNRRNERFAGFVSCELIHPRIWWKSPRPLRARMLSLPRNLLRAWSSSPGSALSKPGPGPGACGTLREPPIRQLLDILDGTRHGLWSWLMKPSVAKKTDR